MADILSMRALIKEKPEKGYELKEIAIPDIKSDEVLFKVEKVAICGSDIALYLWNEVAKVIGTIPFIPGMSIYFFEKSYLLFVKLFLKVHLNRTLREFIYHRKFCLSF